MRLKDVHGMADSVGLDQEQSRQGLNCLPSPNQTFSSGACTVCEVPIWSVFYSSAQVGFEPHSSLRAQESSKARRCSLENSKFLASWLDTNDSVRRAWPSG